MLKPAAIILPLHQHPIRRWRLLICFISKKLLLGNYHFEAAMTYNGIAQTFAPLGGVFAPFPAITESFDGRTLAQLVAAGFTAISCATATTTLISAASKRTTGITIICPIDQQSVALDNATPIVGPFFPETLSI